MAAIHYSLSGCVSESTSDHVLFNLVSWVVGEPLTIIMLLSKTKAWLSLAKNENGLLIDS